MLSKIPPEMRKAFKSTSAGLYALRGVVTQATSGSVIDDIVAFARSSNEVRRVCSRTRTNWFRVSASHSFTFIHFHSLSLVRPVTHVHHLTEGLRASA